MTTVLSATRAALRNAEDSNVRLRSERDDLANENHALRQEREALERKNNTQRTLLDSCLTQRTAAENGLHTCREQSTRVFERRDVEAFTRPQLVSFIEQAINEARRKGMLEAEGLMSRHRELSTTTDLEVMRGIVKSYSERIKLVEENAAAIKAASEARVKLDQRPLAEKLKQPVSMSNNARYAWWNIDEQERDFKAFDDKAKQVSKLAAEQAEFLAKTSGPKTLSSGQAVNILGDSGTPHVLSRQWNTYSCSCPAWVHQKVDATRRTCKHLKRYLGPANEEKRITQPQASCYCGVILVNGQCQIHTKNWRGDEYCNCGRRFEYCKAEYDNGRAPTAGWHKPRLAGTPEPVEVDGNVVRSVTNGLGVRW